METDILSMFHIHIVYCLGQAAIQRFKKNNTPKWQRVFEIFQSFLEYFKWNVNNLEIFTHTL